MQARLQLEIPDAIALRTAREPHSGSAGVVLELREVVVLRPHPRPQLGVGAAGLLRCRRVLGEQPLHLRLEPDQPPRVRRGAVLPAS